MGPKTSIVIIVISMKRPSRSCALTLKRGTVRLGDIMTYVIIGTIEGFLRVKCGFNRCQMTGGGSNGFQLLIKGNRDRNGR